jgi:hypothetical protein
VREGSNAPPFINGEGQKVSDFTLKATASLANGLKAYLFGPDQ